MNIFVCVKQVPDTETRVQPASDSSYIETSSVKWVVNAYDEYAIEQALIVKANNSESNVTVVRVGGVKDTEALRTALAMGADDAILVDAPDNLDSYSTAKALKGAIEKSGKTPDLVFCGMGASDDDAFQVPQILAQLMDIPCVSFAVEFEQNGDTVTVKREVEGGALEVYEVKTPCMVTTNQGLNTPRYASLPGIMKAKKKPLDTYTLADVGVTDADQRLKYSDYTLPPEKPAGKTFDAMDEATQQQVVAEVVGLLRSEAKVI